jgi:hypothetical protein
MNLAEEISATREKFNSRVRHNTGPEEVSNLPEAAATTGVVGMKFDENKTRYDLIPVEALRMVADVLTDGAKKYSDDNWRIVENAPRRYTAASFRHGEYRRGGEVIDPDSGFHHLAHKICCDLFRLQLDIESIAASNATTDAGKSHNQNSRTQDAGGGYKYTVDTRFGCACDTHKNQSNSLTGIGGV